LVASEKDGLFFTGEFVSWCDVADRGVKAHGVILFDEAADRRRASWRLKGTPGRMQFRLTKSERHLDPSRLAQRAGGAHLFAYGKVFVLSHGRNK